nr:unnamed protein product [Callosobruchus chinensis]
MALDNHVVKKHPDFITSVTSKLYECTECHYKTTMKHDFNRHTSMHQGTTPSYSVTCAHCNVKLKSKRALDDHVIRKHPDFVTSVSRKIHECSMCSYKTLHKSSFDKHMTTHTETTSSAGISRECIHCNATFKSRASLDDHTLRKHPDFIATITRKIYECINCIYKTTIKSHFNKHMSVTIDISSDSETVFRCFHCETTFKSKLAVDYHVVEQHPNFIASIARKIYECTKCGYKTIFKYHFERHMSTHPKIASSYEPKACVHCNATFKRKLWLDDHVVRKHVDFMSSVTSKLHECTKCSYKTVRKKLLVRHMLMHPEIASSYTPGMCIHCKETFKNKIWLDDHVVKKHPNFITSVTSKLYECSQCIYKTVIERSFDQHMSMHSATASTHKPNPCIHCNATFKNKGSLNDHILKKHPDFVSSITKKINTCTTCNFKTTIKHQFDRHMSVHSGISPISKTFTCIHCDAIVKSRNALTDHVVRKHPNFITSVTNKIYECTQCVYKTVKKYDLDKHLSTHSKTASRSNFSTCIHCNATFNTDKWLDAHIVKTHPGFAGSLTRKIYECTLCPYKTVFKYKLDRHMLKHAETDKINACIHCNATFKNKADLDEHVVRRHPNFTSSLSRKIYECTQCVYKSLRKKSFVKHMSRHPEAVPGDSLNRCVHCNATLRSKRALDDHVVRKHPDSAAPVGRKILECTECRFKTVLKGSLAQHMLTHFKAYNL